MSQLKYQESARAILENFTNMQSSTSKKQLFNFLSIMSESFSIKRGHKQVEPGDSKTAMIFYYILSHCSNITRLIAGDKTIIYKHSESDAIPEEVQLTLPALKRFEVIKSRLNSLLDKRSAWKKGELESSILILASIIAKNQEINRKILDDSYNLFRIFLFRSPMDEFDTLHDYFHILTSKDLLRLNQVKVQKRLELGFSKTFHYAQGKRLYEEGLFPSKDLELLGVTRFPLNTLFITLAQLHGMRKGLQQVTIESFKDILDRFQNLLLKYDFDRQISAIHPLCSIKMLYEHGFVYKISEKAKDLLFHFRRSLTNSMINLVGKREFLFSHSNLVAKVVTGVTILGAVSSYRRIENHDDITIDDIKKSIRAFYNLLQGNHSGKKSSPPNEIREISA